MAWIESVMRFGHQQKDTSLWRFGNSVIWRNEKKTGSRERKLWHSNHAREKGRGRGLGQGSEKYDFTRMLALRQEGHADTVIRWLECL